MSWRIARAVIAKDLTLFFRNRFFAYVSVAGLIAYVALYLAMPRSVDEILKLGLYAPQIPPILEQLREAQGLTIETFDSEATLKEAVAEGQYYAGVVLPPDFMDRLAKGNQVRVDVWFSSQVPDELEDSVTALLQNLAFSQSGRILTVEISRQVLGDDLAGRQIPPRDRMLPLISTFIILVETLGLASLISEEIEARTIQALLITPLTVRGFFMTKGMTGVGLAFGQAMLFMIVTGALSRHPALLLIALFLGAILVTGISFLLASLGKDLMSVMAWGIPVLITLSIPSFGVLFPGTISDWIKAIPSFYLADTIHHAANLGSDWSQLWGNLLVLLGFDVAFIGLGILALRRRVR